MLIEVSLELVVGVILAGLFGGIEIAGVLLVCYWKNRNRTFLIGSIALACLFVLFPMAWLCELSIPTTFYIAMESASSEYTANNIFVLGTFGMNLCDVVIIAVFGTIGVCIISIIENIRDNLETKLEMWEFRDTSSDVLTYYSFYYNLSEEWAETFQLMVGLNKTPGIRDVTIFDVLRWR